MGTAEPELTCSNFKKTLPEEIFSVSVHICACVVLFCTESYHSLYCSVIVVEFIEKHFLASVLPLSASWMVLWIYLCVVSTLSWCYLTCALNCCSIGRLLYQYLKGTYSLIQQRKGLINSQWSEFNWICSIRKKH